MPHTPNVYFVSGHIGRKNVVGIAAYLHNLEESDSEITRFFTYDHDNGEWFHEEIEHHIVSIEYKPNPFSWYLLSKRGVLVEMTAADTREIDIPDADTGPGGYGYVSKVRRIGAHLYVCGFRRQVYRLEGQEWIHVDNEIRASFDDVDHNLEDIDGFAEDDIYAVGWNGEVFHLDGAIWTALSVPTNVNLSSVRCDNGTVYACGDNGVFLRGRNQEWEIYQNPNYTDHLWSLEVYRGTPYVAHLGGLLTFDGTDLVPVQTGLDPDFDAYRLHSCDDILWSFGNQTLAFYDGREWHRVVCPDNV